MKLYDVLISQVDWVLRTLAAPAHGRRNSPGQRLPEATLTDSERQLAEGLMRVNHSGEICAQALYQGQILLTRVPAQRVALQAASAEEVDHLAWCEQRLQELGGRPSFLNPLWYGGSFTLGMMAGMLGERWNLGFLRETELQVEAHLASHLEQLPQRDERSRAIVAQMKIDEAQHAALAQRLGAAEFPRPIKSAMRWASGIMTRIAYRI